MLQERIQRGELGWHDKLAHGRPDHLLEGGFDHRRKATVGIQDGPVSDHRQRAFVHRLNEQTIGMVGAPQGENLLPLFRSDDERVHLAIPDGL